MQIRQFILPFLFLLFLSACGPEKKKPGDGEPEIKEEAGKLNDRAMDIIRKTDPPASDDSLRYALALVDSAINLQSDVAIFYYNKVAIYKSLGKNDSALLVTNTIVEKFPEDFRGFYNRGALLKERGDKKPAMLDFQKSLGLLDKDVKLNENPMDKDAMKIELYSQMDDSVNFKKQLEDFKQKYKNNEKASIIIDSYESKKPQ